MQQTSKLLAEEKIHILFKGWLNSGFFEKAQRYFTLVV